MNRKERVNRDSLTFLAILAIVLFTLMGASALFAQTSENTKILNEKELTIVLKKQKEIKDELFS